MAKDNQITGMAGEFLVAGKLFKLGLQVSVTFGNAKGIDLLARREDGKNFNVQVKTQRNTKENFFLKEKRITNDIIFVFVSLTEAIDKEEYYIVKGSELLNDVKKFYGQNYNRENPPAMSAVRYSSLAEYKDNWEVFNK